MNDHPYEHELRVTVEQAVRPIIGMHQRKMRMRMELLGHLREVFAEELAQSGDPASALATTRERFGNPAELTEKLQSTVPRWERRIRRFETVIEQFGALRIGESSWWGSLRICSTLLLVWLLLGSAFMLPLFAIEYFGWTWRGPSEGVLLNQLSPGARNSPLIVQVLLQFFASLVPFMLCLILAVVDHVLHRSPRQGATKWFTLVRLGVLGGLFALIWRGVMYSLSEPTVPLTSGDLAGMLVGTLGVAVMLPVVAEMIAREWHEKRDWGALELE